MNQDQGQPRRFSAAPKRKVDFGFKHVLEGEKPSLVRSLFDGVAQRYDLMNDLMSAGVHRLWKSIMVDRLAPRPGITLVDVAGGTGDIAFRVFDRIGRRAELGRLLVCDASREMIEVGRDRAWNRGILEGIEWIAADAEALPLADRAADAYTIAFGIRNVTHIERALAEARRVLMPGGRFLCLEFSPSVHPAIARAYEAYSFGVVPLLGELVQRDRASYEYLVESIRRFPKPESFAAMVTEAGLARVKVQPLTGGIAVLFSAWRI